MKKEDLKMQMKSFDAVKLSCNKCGFETPVRMFPDTDSCSELHYRMCSVDKDETKVSE